MHPLEPFSLSSPVGRRQEEVLQELPPKIIQDYPCRLTPIQEFLYSEFTRTLDLKDLESRTPEDLLSSLERGQSSPASASVRQKEEEQNMSVNPLQALMYLRKLVAHPELVMTPEHPHHTEYRRRLMDSGLDRKSPKLCTKFHALIELLISLGILPPDAVRDAGLLSPRPLRPIHEIRSAHHRRLSSRAESSSSVSTAGRMEEEEEEDDIGVETSESEDAAAAAESDSSEDEGPVQQEIRIQSDRKDDGLDSAVGRHRHRALIFAQQLAFLDLLERDLLSRLSEHLRWGRIDGRMNSDSRFREVRRFQEDPSLDLLLLSTHAAGLGLNLTGADTVSHGKR